MTQEELLKSGNPELICIFARCGTLSNSDIKEFQDALIKIGKAEYIMKFALTVVGADIDLLFSEAVKLNYDGVYNEQIKKYIQILRLMGEKIPEEFLMFIKRTMVKEDNNIIENQDLFNNTNCFEQNKNKELIEPQ